MRLCFCIAGLVSAFILTSYAGPARAVDLPDAATVRRNVREATGAELKTEHLTVSYDAFGLHGTRATVRSGDDFRETTNDGPFTTARGRFHGQAWHQNANGQTVYDQPDPGLAVQETFTTTVAAITEPVRGFVIASLNARGEGNKEYVDASSWHMVRRDVVSATGTRTFAYDDFRTVAGHTQPWHWTARDGHPENDADNRVEHLDATAVSDPDLAIPPSRRQLVEFPAGKTSVSLPVRADHDRFLVRVIIGARGLDFQLDTGAAEIVMDDAIVRELGLKTYGTNSNAANAGRYTSTSTIVPEMRVGDLTLHDVVVGTIPHVNGDRPGEFKMVGLLGFDFIASLVLQMDYERGQVTALEPASFAPPQDPLTNVLAVRLGNGTPLTDVTVNGGLGERFIVDTGAGTSVLIFDYFVRRHQEALRAHGAAVLGSANMYGVGGTFQTQRYRLPSVRIGRVDFKDFTAGVVSSSTSYGGRYDGLIGTQFLKIYTLFTDYQNSMLYLVPNRLGHAAIGH